MLRLLFLLFFIYVPIFSHAQGKILLVGGGSENYNAWSDTPYQWALDQSANKKVAIISYDAGSDPDWLADYFKSLGAVEAKNFVIASRSEANDQSMVNEIKTFDVFFFKGGDQSRYYEYYKNTLLHTEVEEKFQQGGVIGGTSAGAAIMAGISYTAENGSSYPDEAIANVFNNDITLKNDFLNILPDVITDTHFTERGRQARLMSFMAHWYLQNQEMPVGIGVDDRTALCIDENMLATAYGTGSVAIYSAASLTESDQKLIADSLHAVQLLHTHQYDLDKMQLITGSEQTLTTSDMSETGNYQVVLHSENIPGQDLLDHLFNDKTLDSAVIVSQSENGASGLITALQNYGLQHLQVITTDEKSNSEDSAALRNFIKTSRYIFFLNNNVNQLFQFLTEGPTGQLLASHIKRNGITSVLIGEDMKFAGHSFATNVTAGEYIAYDGNLQYTEGLGLLENTIIMPDTYAAGSTDYYENKVSAVLYQMVQQPLKYGIYLNRRSYLIFSQADGENILQSFGDFPAIIAELEDGKAALNSNPRSTNPNIIRDIAGFSNLTYRVISGNQVVVVGEPVASNDPPYELEEVPIPTGINLDKNMQPRLQWLESSLLVSWPVSENFSLQAFDITGQLRWQTHGFQEVEINFSSLSRGLFILKATSKRYSFRKKIMIRF